MSATTTTTTTNAPPYATTESRKRSGSTEDGRTKSGESDGSDSASSPVSENGKPGKKQRRHRSASGEIRCHEIENVRTPQPNDVLCGRGGGTNNHVGNENFRVLVNKRKRDYLNSSKREKPLVSKAIVREIRDMDGRFLCKDESTNLWYDIGDRKAREKTSQALREGAPEIRKELGVDDVKTRQEVLTCLINTVVNGTRIVNPSEAVAVAVDDRRGVALPTRGGASQQQQQQQRLAWQRQLGHVLPHAAVHPTPVAPNYGRGDAPPPQPQGSAPHLQPPPPPPHAYHAPQPRPPFGNGLPPNGRASFSSIAAHPSQQPQPQQQLPLQHQPHHRHQLLHSVNYGHARPSAQQPLPRRDRHHHGQRHGIVPAPPSRIAPQYPQQQQQQQHSPGRVPANVLSSDPVVAETAVTVTPSLSVSNGSLSRTTGRSAAAAADFRTDKRSTPTPPPPPPPPPPPVDDGRLSRDVLHRLTVGDYLTRVACDGRKDTLDMEREAHLYQDAGIMGLDPRQVLAKDLEATGNAGDALSDDTVRRVRSALESMGVALPYSTVIAGT